MGDKIPIEINLADSRLRHAKKSGMSSGGDIRNYGASSSYIQNQQLPPRESARTYDENMLITTFTQLRQSLQQSFAIDKDREGGSKGSQNQSAMFVDPAKKSIAAGKASIYSATNQAPKASTVNIKLDQKDPAQRAVFQEQMQNAEEEYRTMDDHKISVEELLDRLKVDEKNGLSEEEASRRNVELGDNKLPEGKKTPAWILFIKELLNWFAIMLWVGGGLCIMAYFLQPSQGPSNIYLSIVLFAVIILTGSITYMQTSKSEALMESFKNFLPPQCSVIRGGEKLIINAVKLVPGDIVELDNGMKVPADIRILLSRELKVDNSPLTGEPDLLLRKRECTNDNALETANLAFFGTLAKEGKGQGVVIRIGSRTVLAQIACFASQGEKVKTPLRIELDRFVLLITIIALALGVIFFFSARYIVGYSWNDCIVFGIGILVANVPEGLLGCITISLAITAKRLHEKQVLVKNLESVETLGSTSCICSDKTGTLTQNKMTVENVWYDDMKRKALNRQKFGPGHDYLYVIQDKSFQALHECAIISSEATFNVPKDQYSETVWLDAPVIGDASETALVKFFQPIEDIEQTRAKFKFGLIADGQPAKMPFNSANKYALTIIQYQKQDSEYCVLIKGAPEKIWSKCTQILYDGGNLPLNQDWNKKFERVNLEFGKNGERVLGFAKLHLLKEEFPPGFVFDTSSPDNFNFPLKNLTFVGLISLMDPPKDSVPWAVKKCRSAGIKVVMVTGDQPPTAGAIAKMVNIIPPDVLTNVDLMEENEDLTWEEATKQARAIIVHGDRINEAIQNQIDQGVSDEDQDLTLREWCRKDFCVFARTTPAQKLKIVRACQRVGYICGVTGDGVNDSPAIKQGDIGISMGITGSDVTKDAADMILLNDDFASIVDGVEEGRKIFDNLKKTIVYLLTSNVTEIFPFLAQILFLIPLPLSNMLMLCICVGTDILPALSLAYEAAEIDIMIRRPRTKNEHLVTRKLITHAYLQMGVISTGGGFFAFFTTMWYYGFEIGGMFSNKLGIIPAATRCVMQYESNACNCTNYAIPYGSYDNSSTNLGNPYLLTSQPGSMNPLSAGQLIYIENACCTTTSNFFPDASAKVVLNGENCQYQDQLDWLFYTDMQFDLRQILVNYNAVSQTWSTKPGIFRECQYINNSQYMGFEALQNNKAHFETSPLKIDYPDKSNVNPPVCYSTEALKYAQTAYFVAIVVTQWSNILACKCKKMPFIYSPFNDVMLYGILLETFLCIFLCYVPGVQKVFLSRPLSIWQWSAGMLFSIALLVWVEVRKMLLRKEAKPGQRNWIEFIADW